MFNTDVKKKNKIHMYMWLCNQCSALQYHENHVHIKMFEYLKFGAKGCNCCFCDITVFG